MSDSGGSATLAIGGPTATGKTLLAVELARRTGAELLNADSRQVVRRLVVGTARPTAAELQGVRCHLLDLCEPGEPFSVADWLGHARASLAELDSRAVPAIVVGGTGQYLRALRHGWDFGRVAPTAALREELTARAATPAGLAELVAEVRARDPTGAPTLDLANPRRVIRALELLREGKAPLQVTRGVSSGRPLALVVLDAEMAVHADALAARLEGMFDGGAIVEETRTELAHGVARSALERAGIGYAEALAVIDGALDPAAARARAAIRTRRYVKAQRTWFRHEPAILRLQRGEKDSTAELADAVATALPTPAGSPR